MAQATRAHSRLYRSGHLLEDFGAVHHGAMLAQIAMDIFSKVSNLIQRQRGTRGSSKACAAPALAAFDQQSSSSPGEPI
jgi:hypothetical protein